MIGCFYFPNNLKYINDGVVGYILSYQIFFWWKLKDFKENMDLLLPLPFYSTVSFVIVTVFISEKILSTGLEPC